MCIRLHVKSKKITSPNSSVPNQQFTAPEIKDLRHVLPPDATHSTSAPKPLKMIKKKVAKKTLDSTDPAYRKHYVLKDYDATINDPSATRKEKKEARAASC